MNPATPPFPARTSGPVPRSRSMLIARRVPDGALVWVSEDFAEMTGRDPGPFLTGEARISDLVADEDLDQFGRDQFDPGQLELTDEDHAAEALAWRLVLPDGTVRRVRSQVVATLEVASGWWRLSLVEDIGTGLADLATVQPAEEAGADPQRRLLARVGQELSTPAATVLASAEALAATDLDEEGRAVVERLCAVGHEQVAFADDLLRVAGGKPGAASDVDVGALAREECASSVAGAGPDVEWSVVCDAPVVVRADAGALRRVLSNLCSNAAKYGGGTVTVRVRGAGAGAVVEVADDGSGIDEADLARIWEPFERLGAGATSVPGTGLGLPIVAQAVEELKGSVSVVSTPTGTTFAVELGGPEEPVGAGQLSVLVVDDNPTFADVLGTMLLRFGGFTDVRTAGTGAGAVAAAGERAPDVVLLDRHLPDGHGESFIAALRDAAGSEVPVIVISADATELSRRRCLAAGADDYVTKPPVAEELCERVLELGSAGRRNRLR